MVIICPCVCASRPTHFGLAQRSRRVIVASFLRRRRRFLLRGSIPLLLTTDLADGCSQCVYIYVSIIHSLRSGIYEQVSFKEKGMGCWSLIFPSFPLFTFRNPPIYIESPLRGSNDPRALLNDLILASLFPTPPNSTTYIQMCIDKGSLYLCHLFFNDCCTSGERATPEVYTDWFDCAHH